MDLDHFKRFNDGFGHEAGDLVLRETARVLTAGLRGTDIVCRIGGEELVALLLDSTADDAATRLEAVRRQLASLSLRHQGRSLPPVTLSIGVAQAPAHGGTAEDLLRAADLALYAAKEQGRDRIVVAAGVPPSAAAKVA